MATLGEIVVIAQGMRAQFGADARISLAKEIAAHLRDGDIETARFWKRVVDAMTAIENEGRPLPTGAKLH
ncbi:MAG TPA: hypothetical protein VMF58_18270 [Rhizomicrobium sp.]|nr:hypothetical protein [Rhizomicrobium sp.]